MLNKEERKKRDSKLFEEVKQLECKNCYLRANILDQSTSSKKSSKSIIKDGKDERKRSLSVLELPLNRRATVNFKENIPFHKGDNADDINFDDCL